MRSQRRSKHHPAHAEKIQAGDIRTLAWNALSTAQKIRSLDERLGVGVGAVRQRQKLSGVK